jgi:hypothetical protein
MRTCDCCKTQKATKKDYRETKDHIYNFIVCDNCLLRTNQSFFVKMNKKKEVSRKC